MTNRTRCALSYLVTALVFLGMDFCWISSTSQSLYQPILSAHLAAQVDWSAVAAFYALYFVGITFFVVRPLENQRRLVTLGRGVLFGVVAYATYDLTNQASLSGWPWYLSLIDMAWGGIATATASLVTRLFLEKLPKRGD